MAFSFRFCVLCAVSTQDQAAEGKGSLGYQYTAARDYGERMGGTFVRDYVADGYSRSGYYNLSDAFRDAPPLGDMARDASRHDFDVILMESYDRLGDLGFMLWSYLKSIGAPYIQLRSVQQALPISDPAAYNPFHDDLTPTVINNSLNTNVYRIHKIVRAFAVGNPKRARDGKYAVTIPLGYKKIDKENVKVDARVAALLVKFPAWFLSGMATHEIAQRANQSGVKSKGKQWTHQTVNYILKNPFYAGKTFYNRGHVAANKSYKLNPSVELYDGRHEALWDYETHLKILAEYERRAGKKKPRESYNLTSLLDCEVCGRALRLGYSGVEHRKVYKYWRCENKHITIKVERANEMVAAELERLFSWDAEGIEPAEHKVKDLARRELAAVRRDIANLDARMDAFSPSDFIERRKKLLARESELLDEERQKQENARREVERVETRQSFRDLSGGFLFWLQATEPMEVRFRLSRAVKFTAHRDKTITAELI